MNDPVTAAHRFAQALLLGMGLGLVYGFLRPLRRRRHWPADMLFLAIFFWVWLYLNFALCGGDLRVGYTAGLVLGIFLWEGTFGRHLRRVFALFWHGLGRFFLPFKKILKKIGDFAKFLFATGKKWGTIKWRNRQHIWKNPEAHPMANRKNPFSRIRLVYRRSSTLLKCVVLSAIVLSTIALTVLFLSISDTHKATDDLRHQAARLEQENRELTEAIAEAGTVQSIKRIAMEQLGLVDPDSEFFEPVASDPE